MVKKYFNEIGLKRFLVMLFGNIFLGMGVSIFKFSRLGNDAFNGMVMALSDVIGIPYARFFVIFSICLFAVEALSGKNFIGIGTIVNTFFLGYIVTFLYDLGNYVFCPGYAYYQDCDNADWSDHLQSWNFDVSNAGCRSITI